MQKYVIINEENLLITSDCEKPKVVHYSFYDKHIKNLVEESNEELDTNENILEQIGVKFKKKQIDVNEALDNLHLFKFMDIRSLSYLLKDKRLYWDRVSDSWEDPYENFILKENFVLTNGTPVDASNNIPGVFGQCWSYREETDAMWRIYSEDDKDVNQRHLRNFHGVRIETTARKLLNTIYVDETAMADTWMGKVNYMDVNDINSELQAGEHDIRDLLNYSFFVKRKEFDHEAEFRAMKLFDSDTIPLTQNYKRIAFDIADVDDFIESFTLDPRLNDSDYQIYKNQLISLGVKPYKIKKSSLYEFVPVKVTLG